MAKMVQTLIEFAKKQAQTFIKRAERGTLLIPLLHSESTKHGIFILEDEESIEKIPSGITEQSLSYIKRGFIGSVTKPKKVIVVISDTTENILKLASTVQFNYIVPPYGAKDEDFKLFLTFIKDLRDNKKVKAKAVLPNNAADYEGVINFTTNNIKVDNTVYNSSEYCSRIAGVIVGTPLKESTTFKVLQEVTDIERFTNEEMNTKISNGEFILMHDGVKVKVARGVTSIKTITGSKNADMQYIKLMDAMDMIYSDLRILIDDYYIGKFPNDYDNKLNLIQAVDTYFVELEKQKVITPNYTIGLNIDAIIAYLKTNGKYNAEMKEQDIKEANTGANVYLKGYVELINSIEDVQVLIEM